MFILQAGRSSVQQRCCSRRAVLLCCNVIRIGRGIRCRYGRSRRAILYRHDDCAASISKSGIEIKNRCTKEGVIVEKLASILKSGLEIKNRCTQKDVSGEKLTSIPKFGLEIKNRCTKEGIIVEKLASIPKFGLEIKNRCTKEGVIGEKLASILKSGLEIKNRCMKQHIPRHAFHRAPKHASCLGCFAWWRARAGSTVAAKVGADAPGGGISLCFCRRGCAAPALKPPRSTSCHAHRPTSLNVLPRSTSRRHSGNHKRG